MIIFSYFLYYFIILPVSYLPFPVLYFISDFFFFLVYYLFPYRKRVILHNLKNSFSEKSTGELEQIAKKFYSHFCDIIVESIKTFSISEKEITKRMKWVNPEILFPFYDKKKGIIAVMGHYCNWEWVAVSCQLVVKHRAYGVYLPLKNKFFDKKVQQSRASFGVTLMSVSEVRDYFEQHKEEVTFTGMIVDQAPSNTRKCHWMQFLNQDTPVFLGTEKYAVQCDFPVFYGKAKKVKRGFYELELVPVTVEPTKEEEFFITEKHTGLLEKQIRENPEFWLWSHKRWKHKREAGNPIVI